MNNSNNNSSAMNSTPGIFNWFARYEETAHQSQYEVNLPSDDEQEDE
ncbi:MAG: hypothetical protein SWN10_05390 [Pseudomonadota bacterium]|nr:hypothetical protein [Pseudomonadota bacterium]